MTKHICTSGTSIGGGPMRDNDIGAYRSTIAERVRQFREQYDASEFLAKVSAETNSLSRVGLQADDQVILLCTDTEDGAACAKAVAEVLKHDLGAQVEIRRIEGLQVTDAKAFERQGIPRLFETLNKISGEGARYEGVRLNATGGFKSVVPFLTLYGLIKRLPVDYLFERSETPLSLPPAPVNFDYDLLRYAEPALRALKEEAVVSRERFSELLEGLDYEDRTFLAECLTESDGDSVIAPPGQNSCCDPMPYTPQKST